MREVNKEAADAEEAEEDKDGENKTSTTRSFVCEQQRLRVPATEGPSAKLKDFHDQIVELSQCRASLNTLEHFVLVLIPDPSALRCDRECQGTESCRAG